MRVLTSGRGRPGLAPSRASVLGLEVATFSLCFSDRTLPAQRWKEVRGSCGAQSGRRPGRAGERRAQAQRNARAARAATRSEDPQSEPPLSEVRPRRRHPGGGRRVRGPGGPFRGADHVPVLGLGAAFRAAFSWGEPLGCPLQARALLTSVNSIVPASASWFDAVLWLCKMSLGKAE